MGDHMFLDTSEEWNGKSSPVYLVFDQHIRAGSSSDDAGFFWVRRQFVLGKIVIDWGHPAVTITNEVYVKCRGRLLDAWSRKNFLDDGLVSALFLRAREF